MAGDTFNRVFIGESREAPAVFKSEGAYLIVSSGCSGWAPNAAEVHVAADMMGEWTSLGNPAQGTESERKTTFRSQSTFVLPLRGRPGEYSAITDGYALGITLLVTLTVHSPLRLIEKCEDEFEGEFDEFGDIPKR